MDSPRCDKCKYWDGGCCRRRSPAPFNDDKVPPGVGAFWPSVLPNDWCGEFKQKEDGDG